MKNKIFQLVSNLFWSFKFYLRVGKHKNMHSYIYTMASYSSIVLGTMSYQARNLEFTIYFSIGVFLYICFFMYFTIFISNYLEYNNK